MKRDEEHGHVKRDEPWWTWHWDNDSLFVNTCTGIEVVFRSIHRWRRGSLLTIYRFESMQGDIWWWFYGPFNLAIGFGKS